MSVAHAYDPVEIEDAPPEPAVSTLTERLNAKLVQLAVAGHRIQYIEIAEPQMVTLFAEGGDEALRLDDDPASDRAWYADYEVRATDKELIWIWIEGEHAEPSAHIVD
ncbi:MAG: hypothetical protein ACXWKM_12510 [Phenylobacterium sp.]